MATKGQKAGMSVAALATAGAAAAAGYYFYASKDAKQNRRIAAKWATNLKSDVVREAKKVQKIDRATMLKMVDKAAAAYETVRSVDRSDLERAVRELKNNWTILTQEAGGSAKTSGAKKSPARSAAKSSAKTAKKAPAKKKSSR